MFKVCEERTGRTTTIKIKLRSRLSDLRISRENFGRVESPLGKHEQQRVLDPGERRGSRSPHFLKQKSSNRTLLRHPNTRQRPGKKSKSGGGLISGGAKDERRKKKEKTPRTLDIKGSNKMLRSAVALHLLYVYPFSGRRKAKLGGNTRLKKKRGRERRIVRGRSVKKKRRKRGKKKASPFPVETSTRDQNLTENRSADGDGKRGEEKDREQ